MKNIYFRYELFSFGETPYRDIEVFQVKRHVLSGRILEKPPYANENVYVSIECISSAYQLFLIRLYHKKHSFQI